MEPNKEQQEEQCVVNAQTPEPSTSPAKDQNDEPSPPKTEEGETEENSYSSYSEEELTSSELEKLNAERSKK